MSFIYVRVQMCDKGIFYKHIQVFVSFCSFLYTINIVYIKKVNGAIFCIKNYLFCCLFSAIFINKYARISEKSLAVVEMFLRYKIQRGLKYKTQIQINNLRNEERKNMSVCHIGDVTNASFS